MAHGMDKTRRRRKLPDVRQVARPRIHGNVPMGRRNPMERHAPQHRSRTVRIPNDRVHSIRTHRQPNMASRIPQRLRILVRIRRRATPLVARIRTHSEARRRMARHMHRTQDDARVGPTRMENPRQLQRNQNRRRHLGKHQPTLLALHAPKLPA